MTDRKAIVGEIRGRRVLDNRGETSVEVDILTTAGYYGRASAPFGAPGSRGEFEPPGYPEGGVDAALEFLETTAGPALLGASLTEQEEFDARLRQIDGTSNFARMGANLSTVLSMACARAAAATAGLPLHRYLGGEQATHNCWPIMNTIGGGAHALRGTAPDMQEHHLIPVGANDFEEAIFASRDAWLLAGELCRKKAPEFTGGVDDEAAWIPSMSDWEALEVLNEVCEIFGEKGIKMMIGVDAAATNLYDKDKDVYRWHREKRVMSPDEHFAYICKMAESFPMYYMEDIFHEGDIESFIKFTAKYGNRMLICGDDILVSNAAKLKEAVGKKAANSIVIKTNMTGTLTDTYRTVKLAHDSGWVPVKSRRSGETEDPMIAELALAWGCPLGKFGGMGGITVAKVNQQLRLAEESGILGTRPPTLPLF